MRPQAGLQLVPHRGDAAQVVDHLTDIFDDVRHLFVRVVFAHGQAQRTVCDLVRQPERQQHMAGVERAGGAGAAGRSGNALAVEQLGQQQAGGGGNFDRLVDSLGIAPILKKTPVECSGGEKARAVFARGVIMNPHIVLADEPTASLDAENKAKVLDLLLGLNREHGTTVITVTHDMDVANQHDRVVALKKRM